MFSRSRHDFLGRWCRSARLAAIVVLALPAVAAADPSPPAQIRQNTAVQLDADKAQLIQLPEPAKTVFVANPDIADIHLANPTSVLVYGKHIGSTTVFAISESGVTSSYSVSVSRATGDIAAALRRVVPNAQISVTSAPDGLTLSGRVSSPRDAAQLKAAAQQFVGEKQSLNFNVIVDSSTQVTLRVRVAEVSRTIDRRIGVSWDQLFGSNSLAVAVLSGTSIMAQAIPPTSPTQPRSQFQWQVNVNNLINALDQQGLATILAEPTLTAASGETANFLAGGEFPIPVPQANATVTVDYKRFGVSVDFTPTVLDGNRISIKVRPEVSQLTTVGDLRLNNVEIPALTVRRAETTVELGSGESFAIAGLFQNNGTNQISALPGIGDVPIIGALFRSSSFQRNESELVIIVTPYIVHPVSRAADLHTPMDNFQFSSELERILQGRLAKASPSSPASASVAQPPQRLRGPADFMLE